MEKNDSPVTRAMSSGFASAGLSWIKDAKSRIPFATMLSRSSTTIGMTGDDSLNRDEAVKSESALSGLLLPA